jgi:hypothetical protein
MLAELSLPVSVTMLRKILELRAKTSVVPNSIAEMLKITFHNKYI